MTDGNEKKELTFSYKIFEAVFLSLFLSTFVSLLEAGSYLEMNLVSLIIGHSSLFLPLLLSVFMYYIIYMKRYEFNESLGNWTNFVSIVLVLAVFSIFQEIIPFMRLVSQCKSFQSIYIESAFLHPISILLLVIGCAWLYDRAFKKASNKQHSLILIFAGILCLPEAAIIENRIMDTFGMAKGSLIIVFLFVIGFMIRRYWLRD